MAPWQEHTTLDMWQLAAALHTHGCHSHALLPALPDWSASDLEHVMRRFRNRADRERKRQAQISAAKGGSGVPLLQWTSLVRKVHVLQGTAEHVRGYRNNHAVKLRDHGMLLSQVMLFFACFEDHFYRGKDSEPSFSEVYRFLSQLLAGREPTQLRPASAKLVLKVMDQLAAAAHQLRGQLGQLGSDAAREDAMNEGLFGEAPSSAPSLEEALAALSSSDPGLEDATAAAAAQIQSTQLQRAAPLTPLPGINPLHLPPSLLAVPKDLASKVYLKDHFRGC